MYQEKPHFPVVASTSPGEKVTLEGVKVTSVFDIAQGDPEKNQHWTRQDFRIESVDGQFGEKIKYWSPARVIASGQIITIVGKVEEYMGKKSVSVDSAKGGGIASEGEPLATVAAPTVPAPQPAMQAPASHKMHVDEYRSFLLQQTKKVLESDTVVNWLEGGLIDFPQAIDYARALASGIGIALLRKDVDEELPF